MRELAYPTGGDEGDDRNDPPKLFMQAEHEPEPKYDPLGSGELEHPKAPAIHGYVILKWRESKAMP